MKKNNLQKYCMVFCLAVFFHLGYVYGAPFAENTKPVAWWNFNSSKSGIITDEVSNVKDSIQGNFKLVNGTDGRALKLDGFTTCVTRKADMVPKLGDSFAFEAWIAAATYPWNWCPILAQEKNKETGFYFGVGPQGQVGIFASINGVWQSCETEEKIALKKWIHLAVTFDKNIGIRIYINGELSGQLNAKGKPVFATETDLLIGMNSEKLMPSNPVRTYATLPTWYSFDGIFDEIKIYDEALSLRVLEPI